MHLETQAKTAPTEASARKFRVLARQTYKGGRSTVKTVLHAPVSWTGSARSCTPGSMRGSTASIPARRCITGATSSSSVRPMPPLGTPFPPRTFPLRRRKRSARPLPYPAARPQTPGTSPLTASARPLPRARNRSGKMRSIPPAGLQPALVPRHLPLEARRRPPARGARDRAPQGVQPQGIVCAPPCAGEQRGWAIVQRRRSRLPRPDVETLP
jgi:hypothetical protein